MNSREDWQRRLGPFYGGAVGLVGSTSWSWPQELKDDLASAGWVVALGLPIGLAAWMIAFFLEAVGLPPGLASVMGLATMTFAAAGVVERGLGEQVDQWARSAQLGVAAVVVVAFATILRAMAIAHVAPGRWLVVFVTAAVVGRWAAVFLQALGDPLRDEPPRRSLMVASPPLWVMASLSGAVVVLVALVLGAAGVVAMVITAIVAFVLGLGAQRRDRGLSSPSVAAAAAVGELLVLLVATISG